MPRKDIERSKRIDWWRGVVMRALAAMLEDELPQDPLPVTVAEAHWPASR